jgi:hypothetical protein
MILRIPSYFIRRPCHDHAVSHRLPTAAARIRAQVRSCGICDGQSSDEAGFLRVFRYPLLILIPPIAPQSSSSSSSIVRGLYQLVVDVPSGLNLTPPQETKKKVLFYSKKDESVWQCRVTFLSSINSLSNSIENGSS